jgi:hypothetical protein
MSEPRNGRPPSRLRGVDLEAGAGSDGADSDAAVWGPEADAAWLAQDPGFIAGLNRAKSLARERLRADVRSLATDAMATLRELVSGPDIPPSVRLRASLAILQAADAMEVEKIGPMSARGVQAKMDHRQLIDFLGG